MASAQPRPAAENVGCGAPIIATGAQTFGQDGFRMAVLMAVGQSASGGLTLRGRRDECAVLDRLLADARAAHSRVLVLEGEAVCGREQPTRLRPSW